MLLTFQEWYRWQDMLKMAALVVESRTGTDEAALHAAAAELKKAGGRVLFARAESYPCASSDIRSGKIPREQWPEVLPPEVLDSDQGASAVREPVGRPAPRPPRRGEGTPPYA